MAWKPVTIATIEDEYKYVDCRIKAVSTTEYVMHGGHTQFVPQTLEYYVWED